MPRLNSGAPTRATPSRTGADTPPPVTAQMSASRTNCTPGCNGSSLPAPQGGHTVGGRDHLLAEQEAGQLALRQVQMGPLAGATPLQQR